jgi:Flp pilus assembly protein CpaB
LILAIAAGAGAFFLGNLGGGGGGGGGARITVITAKQAVPLRHTITDADLGTQDVMGAFTSVNNIYQHKSDVVGKIAQIQISMGSVITSDMLATDIGAISAGAVPAYLPLPQGYVAITIPTSEMQGVAGHITLGDYITVIASAAVTVFAVGAPPAGPPKIVSKTVFTQVRVIGLGPATSNVQPASGGAGAGAGGAQGPTSGVVSSLTIVLTQCDAEFFTWFLNNTSLKYTLESPKDYLTQPPSTPDSTCPTVLAAQGVSQRQVEQRYHFTSL